ncbi:LolA family protein [Salmonirosea aquatica]|uniref:Outer membrane lipoprotein carrier protein LolA n=1 Tax=Salmonirosea aquatica TaxID=2654236 RepID=A0A7C9B9Q9_9BACT|nr:outer membrane lipoprotein carrier protein LolA [Cytophagaceae bacterium SJW1-29]
MSIPVLAQTDKAAAILDAMSAKYKDMKTYQADFTYSSEGGRDLKGEATVKGDKFRLKMAGQEIFNDGKTMATYVKETNEVNLQDYDPAELGDLNPTQIFTAYKKNYKSKFLKESKEGTQTYETVELAPTSSYAKIAKVQIKVNKQDKSIKSWRILMSNGQQVTYTINSFQPNVNVADSYFAFNAKQYPGVEVVDLR